MAANQVEQLFNDQHAKKKIIIPPAGRALTSDWSENSFEMIVSENFLENSVQNFLSKALIINYLSTSEKWVNLDNFWNNFFSSNQYRTVN